MAPRASSDPHSGAASALVHIQLVQELLEMQLAPLREDISAQRREGEEIRRELHQLGREVRDGNSKSTAMPGRQIVLQANPSTVAVAVVVAMVLIAAILALTGNAARIPEVVHLSPVAANGG